MSVGLVVLKFHHLCLPSLLHAFTGTCILNYTDGWCESTLEKKERRRWSAVTLVSPHWLCCLCARRVDDWEASQSVWSTTRVAMDHLAKSYGSAADGSPGKHTRVSSSCGSSSSWIDLVCQPQICCYSIN